MKKLLFMRWRTGGKPYCSFVGEYDVSTTVGTVEPYFIVLLDNPEGKKIKSLKLANLQKLYPDSQETYFDENEVEQTRTIYGYFSELGRSRSENPPIIEIGDVEWLI